jgi:hypothetical protein
MNNPAPYSARCPLGRNRAMCLANIVAHGSG